MTIGQVLIQKIFRAILYTDFYRMDGQWLSIRNRNIIFREEPHYASYGQIQPHFGCAFCFAGTKDAAHNLCQRHCADGRHCKRQHLLLLRFQRRHCRSARRAQLFRFHRNGQTACRGNDDSAVHPHGADFSGMPKFLHRIFKAKYGDGRKYAGAHSAAPEVSSLYYKGIEPSPCQNHPTGH